MQDASTTSTVVAAASTLQLVGAACFGALIGWYVYFINRYRTSDVQIGDLVTVLGVIGGGAVLALFPAQSQLFGAYGIGLLAGFFGYFFTLVLMVSKSDKFGVEWFLDGRRKKLGDDEMIGPETRPTTGAMLAKLEVQ